MGLKEQSNAGAVISQILDALTDDDSTNLVGNIIRRGLRKYVERGDLSVGLAAVLDLDGVAIFSIDRTGWLAVDSTFRDDAEVRTREAVSRAHELLEEHVQSLDITKPETPA